MSQTAAQRTLGFHSRADLRIQSYRLRGREYWNVKDPLTLRYYQLRAEEYFLLEQLRNPISLEQLQERFQERFAPRRIKLNQLQVFLSSLHSEGLILSDAPGQGEQLLLRRGRIWRRVATQKLSNVLAIRFRGFDPDTLLNWIYPQFRWVYSKPVLILFVLFVLSTLLFAAFHAGEVAQRIPTFTSFLTVNTLVWLFVVIGFTKVIHELGHALTCKHFGGECHELGLMLLVFSPCLYCDVTDSWMSPNKWHRMSVAAAGIFVELGLASAAFLIWWFSEPGLLNTACFTLMTVCSISTLLFNGNPLLRYDGYFVLSDFVEQPNLAQRSSELLRSTLGRWAFGVEPDERLVPETRKRLLYTYAVASLLYRFFVLGVIFWCIYRALAPHDLEHFAVLLAVFVLAGILSAPLVRGYRFLTRPKGRQQMKVLNILCSSAALGAAIWFVGWAPLPHYIGAPVVVRPTDARRLFVTIPGELVRSVEIGQSVSQGDEIAVLRDIDLERRIAELQAQRDEQALHLRNLEKRRALNVEVDSQIPLAKKTLEELEEQLTRRRADHEQLTLRAPVAGAVLPPPTKPHSPEERSWAGSPLDIENKNCFLDRQTLVCLVGDPSKTEAVLIVDQSSIPFVSVGQRVRLQLDQLAGEMLEGEVLEIAEGDLDYVPRELLSAGEMPGKDEAGGVRPATTSYQVRVALSNIERPLIIGVTGNARLYAEPKTIALRVWRFLNRTFQIEMVG